MPTQSNSVQYQKIVDQQNGAHNELKPNELGGRVRVAYFEFTTLAAGGADGDSYLLNRLPKGARVLRIKTTNEALGAGVVAAIGIAGATSKYGSAIDMASAGSDECANLHATYGLETTAEEDLIMTLTGAAPAASKVVKGHVEYAVD